MPANPAVFSVLRTTLVLVLLVGAVAELAVTIVVIGGADSPRALAGLNAPEAFLPLTLAVVLSTLAPPGRLLRGVVAVGAVVFAGVRLGVAGAVVMAEPDVTGLMLGVVPGRLGDSSVGVAVFSGAAVGLVLATWACLEVLRPVSVPHPVLAGTRTTPSPEPAVPPTLVHSSHAGGWSRASTPWPRAVESDPQGTLVRPRLRR